MSITEMGKKGEQLARLFIKRKGFYNLMQLDWVAEKNFITYQFEIKCKEIFTKGGGCGFDGHGLDRNQAERRLCFYKKFGIRCRLIVITDKEVYSQWLDVLWDKEKFITKKGIVIFPLYNFVKESL